MTRDKMLADGVVVADVAKALEVSENTLELGRESQRLKAIVADQALENRAAGDREGTLVSPSRRRRAIAMLHDRLGGSEHWGVWRLPSAASGRARPPKPDAPNGTDLDGRCAWTLVELANNACRSPAD